MSVASVAAGLLALPQGCNRSGPQKAVHCHVGPPAARDSWHKWRHRVQSVGSHQPEGLQAAAACLGLWGIQLSLQHKCGCSIL